MSVLDLQGLKPEHQRGSNGGGGGGGGSNASLLLCDGGGGGCGCPSGLSLALC
jgi:hypothetical protein